MSMFWKNRLAYSPVVVGFLRRILAMIGGRSVYISGSCHCCGKCCRKINLRYENKWISNKHQFNQLVKRHPDYSRFEIVDKDDQGFLQFSCSWLEDNGSCKDYTKRLDVCKKYPSKTLYLGGGNVIDGCGYTLCLAKPFTAHLKEQIKKNNGKNFSS